MLSVAPTLMQLLVEGTLYSVTKFMGLLPWFDVELSLIQVISF